MREGCGDDRIGSRGRNDRTRNVRRRVVDGDDVRRHMLTDEPGQTHYRNQCQQSSHARMHSGILRPTTPFRQAIDVEQREPS